jgi:hypothetical protein
MKNPHDVLKQKRKDYNQAIALCNQTKKEIDALISVIPLLAEESDPPAEVVMP